MLAVLPMLIVYGTVYADHGGLFSSCDRSRWKWVQLYGPCWNSLIKLQVTATWKDITVIIGYALMLLWSAAVALNRCTRVCKNYAIEHIYWKVIVSIAITIIFTAILKAFYFSQQYLTSARPVQTNAISSELSTSLLQYGHDDDITRAWQNTMREGCCCGVYGYQDFTNHDVDIPPHCGCNVKEQQPYLYKGCTRRYDCTASLNTNFTNAGCLSFVVDQVDSTAKSVAAVQFVTVVISVVLILTHVCLPTANKNVTMNDDANLANKQIPQMRYEENTVLFFKGSLSKKLVCIKNKRKNQLFF